MSLEAPDIRDFAVEDPRGFLAQFPKSAETASRSLFAGATRVKGHLESGPKPFEVVAVFGGNRGQRRSGASLVSWSGVGERTWEQ